MLRPYAALVLLAALAIGRSAGQTLEGPVVLVEPQPVAIVLPPIFKQIWRDGFEFGLNGASGNSSLFNLRFAANGQSKARDNLLVGDFAYVFSQQDGRTSAQQILTNVRDEAFLPGGSLSLFAAAQGEYDEMRAYRVRVGAHAGAGYTVADDDQIEFRLRAGAGGIWERGPGLANRWVSELALGYSLQYRLTSRSSFLSVADYYPRLLDPGQFRVRVRAAYECLIDSESGLFLRIGLQERYDSDPATSSRNDLTYYTTLGFEF